jgi:hypothetical protein
LLMVKSPHIPLGQRGTFKGNSLSSSRRPRREFRFLEQAS